MPRGDKSSYTTKQKRQAEHIEKGYEKRGTPAREAARRAWATVNKSDGGGKQSGSGRRSSASASSHGSSGSRGSSGSSHAARSRAAKKGWETRRRNGS